MDSEFDKIDVCVNCKIREFCIEQPDDMSCEEVMRLAGILPKDYDYERASDERDYCEHWEPTYNLDDGSM